MATASTKRAATAIAAAAAAAAAAEAAAFAPSAVGLNMAGSGHPSHHKWVIFAMLTWLVLVVLMLAVMLLLLLMLLLPVSFYRLLAERCSRTRWYEAALGEGNSRGGIKWESCS